MLQTYIIVEQKKKTSPKKVSPVEAEVPSAVVAEEEPLILGAYQPGQLLVGEDWQVFLDKVICASCKGSHDEDNILLCDGPLSTA